MKPWLLHFLRWFMTILFLVMGILKLYFLNVHGFSQYLLAVNTVGLPGIFKYYGLVAMLLEFFMVVGLWREYLYKPAIVSMSTLSVCGTVLSIYFIVFKIKSDCGCGLLGDNEYTLLIQKTVILTLLFILYKNKKYYFIDKSSA